MPQPAPALASICTSCQDAKKSPDISNPRCSQESQPQLEIDLDTLDPVQRFVQGSRRSGKNLACFMTRRQLQPLGQSYMHCRRESLRQEIDLSLDFSRSSERQPTVCYHVLYAVNFNASLTRIHKKTVVLLALLTEGPGSWTQQVWPCRSQEDEKG